MTLYNVRIQLDQGDILDIRDVKSADETDRAVMYTSEGGKNTTVYKDHIVYIYSEKVT